MGAQCIALKHEVRLQQWKSVNCWWLFYRVFICIHAEIDTSDTLVPVLTVS